MATPTPGTGTSTPQIELDPEETLKSLKVSLADLCAKATRLYGQRKYDEAAEVYAQAAEMQAEMNGEMSPDNAEILFLYGRALFKVGQTKSDVLGGRAPEPKKQAPKGEEEVCDYWERFLEQERVEHKLDERIAEAAAKEVAGKEAPKLEQQKKALFQFQGDENFDESESEEEEEGEGEGEEEEEDDDLAMAFEILDLARVLFNKRLEAARPTAALPPTIRHIKERLADTHDLLAEISLENERYPNAITDSRASLQFKEQLYPFESEIIAEAHFKLSLALEFASVTKSSEDDKESGGDNTIDQTLRDEAATELEAAINSTKQKLQTKEVELAAIHNPEDNEATRRQIADVKEVLADMEQRLVDLRKPPVDINAALGIPARQQEPEVKVTEEVKSKATDLTGLVRKKRKAEEKPAEELEAKKIRESPE
ncbi:hypothetical protein N0V88_002441 [Collariella sp. IMI 366227]|nr:hypothetical protein N0V88_002441 [Collariella sp. IMI 366227]